MDLVRGGHPFVELVKNGGEHSLQASHVEFRVRVQVVQRIFPQSFYDVPNVHQVHCTQVKESECISPRCKESKLTISHVPPGKAPTGCVFDDCRVVISTVHSASFQRLGVQCIIACKYLMEYHSR